MIDWLIDWLIDNSHGLNIYFVITNRNSPVTYWATRPSTKVGGIAITGVYVHVVSKSRSHFELNYV